MYDTTTNLAQRLEGRVFECGCVRAALLVLCGLIWKIISYDLVASELFGRRARSHKKAHTSIIMINKNSNDNELNSRQAVAWACSIER